MIGSRLALLFTLALAAPGCEGPTAPGDRDLLTEARARWRAQNQDSYSVELSRSCFCLLGGRSMRLTVKGGAVVAAEFTDSGSPVDEALLTYIPTVPDLFDLIQDALDRRAASFWAEYDPSFGYPTRIEIDYSATTADDEVAYSARGLVFLENAGP